jgi:hypothetical protein
VKGSSRFIARNITGSLIAKISVPPNELVSVTIVVLGHGQAAEVSKGIFQAAQEFIDGLMGHRFAVLLAAVGEHDAKDPARLSSAIRADVGLAPAKVHLRLGAGAHSMRRIGSSIRDVSFFASRRML